MGNRCRQILALVILWNAERALADDSITRLFIRGPLSTAEADNGNVKVLGRSDIERSPSLSVDSFLKQVPGFSLFRRSPSTSTHPTAQGVSLRGTGPSGASRTLVLQDGIPLNDSFGGWLNWQSVSLDEIENVRIEENWGSRHLSFLGLGSVIELETSSPKRDERTVKLSGGSHGTGAAHGRVADVHDRFSYSTQGEFLTSDGYHVISPEDRGSIDVPIDSQHLLGSGKIIVNGPASSHYAVVNSFDERRGGGTPLTNNNTGTYSGAAGGRVSTGRRAQFTYAAFGSGSSFDSTFSSQSFERENEAPASDQYDVPSVQAGLMFDYMFVIDTHTIEIGTDFLRRAGESRELFRYEQNHFARTRTSGAEQYAGGVYIMDHYAISERAALDGMLRLNSWENTEIFRREGGSDSHILDRNDSDSSDLESFVEPRIQISYKIDDNNRLRSALIRGMRLPTINELARPFRVRNDITEANFGLKEEKIIGYDLELRHSRPAFEVSISGYLNYIEDSISNVTLTDPRDTCGFIPEGGTCRQRNNLDSVMTGGTEITTQLQLDDEISLRAGYLLTWSEVSDEGHFEDLEGNRLAQLPLHQATGGVQIARESFAAALQGRFVSSQYEDDLNSLKLSSFFTADASLRYTLSPKIEIFCIAENLFGSRYETGKTSEGLTAIGPPITVLGGIRAHF